MAKANGNVANQRSGQARRSHEDGPSPRSPAVQGRPSPPEHATSYEGAIRDQRNRTMEQDRAYRRGGGFGKGTGEKE